jgi:hypothetical protein
VTEQRRYLDRAAEAALLRIKPDSVSRYRTRHADYPPAVTCPCCGSTVRDALAIQAWKDARPGRTGRPRKTPNR